jgi:beta-glucanase (GH16 family)
MRRLSALVASVALAAVFAAPAAASVLPTTTASWHLVFSDGFGTGSLNTYTWTPNWAGTTLTEITKPPNSYETAAFDPAQVTFDSYGHLVLTTISSPWTTPDLTTTYPYRSGTITGYQKQAYAPDLKVVARLRLPCTSTGEIKNWPSFWLVGDPFQWPQTGEIDVVEGLDGVATWHAHYVEPDGSIRGVGAQVPGNWCGWHTFEVRWRGTTVRWYYDSVKVAEITSFAATAPESPVIMYSMAPPGTLGVCPPNCGGPTVIGARVKADYIRVYTWY